MLEVLLSRVPRHRIFPGVHVQSETCPFILEFQEDVGLRQRHLWMDEERDRKTKRAGNARVTRGRSLPEFRGVGAGGRGMGSARDGFAIHSDYNVDFFHEDFL